MSSRGSTPGTVTMSERSSSRRPNGNRVSDIRERTRQSSTDVSSNETEATASRVKHVQKEWEHRNLYVPEELDRLLEQTREEMGDAVAGQFGGQMAVTRHFYPVMIQLGLDEIRNLSATEFADAVERIPGVGPDEFER